MRLKTLVLEQFGPFEYYEMGFPRDDNVCVLLTGRNNEGKSTIISALRLLHGATRVIRKGNDFAPKQLLKQDTGHLEIGRLIHNYEGGVARIRGIFSNDAEITVDLDGDANTIICYGSRRVPRNVSEIFGFIPPLGQLAEVEHLISDESYLRKSLNTTLAPLHFRNYLYHFLNDEDFLMVRSIVNDYWEGIELGHYDHDIESNRLLCFYSENGVAREIAWAGQGLQVWFQIIAHLVRLKNTSILVLDEPEIFLHAGKQHDLVQMLIEHYDGSIIMATHSIELMNNVDISHIINVVKTQRRPKFKSTTDRRFLELARSHVGSSFNLIASQFDEVDVLIFTEGKRDFDIVNALARAFAAGKRALNVPIGGFSEYEKAVWYKDAYEKFFGKRIQYTVLLDRDYYPEEYLYKVRSDLGRHKIKTVFTPGKEIENVLLDEDLLFRMVPPEYFQELKAFLDQLFDSEYNECLGSFLTLHEHYPSDSKRDAKTVLMDSKPKFDVAWSDPKHRIAEIDGGRALGAIRRFFAEKCSIRLSTTRLISELTQSERKDELAKLVAKVYQIDGQL